MMDFVWMKLQSVLALHKRQIAEHGGTNGMRDEGLLLSALARPENLFAYGENVDVAALAASYAFEIAKNHAFLDGNKRTATVVAITFLNLNGSDLEVSFPEVYTKFLGLAEGSVTEDELADWIRENIIQIDKQ